MKIRKLQLSKKLIGALMALLVAFAALGAATFAWYIYNTSSHTTKVSMAAGTSSSLEISTDYKDGYSSSVTFKSFTGTLMPVSTDRILNGFQVVKDFKEGGPGQPDKVAYLFDTAMETDYYRRSMYLRSSEPLNVYVKNIGIDKDNLMSTSVRIGLVVYKPGEPNEVDKEYIFNVNPNQHINTPVYNTATGEEGYVLDSTKHDGSTVPFKPYTPDNYFFDENSNTNPNRKIICTCPGGNSNPIRVDAYIWMEGCDSDCYETGGELNNISIEFIGEST